MSDARIPVLKDEYDRLKVEAELGRDHRQKLLTENKELRYELEAHRQQYRNLRGQYDQLAEENKTIRVYYKDWCEQRRELTDLPEPGCNQFWLDLPVKQMRGPATAFFEVTIDRQIHRGIYVALTTFAASVGAAMDDHRRKLIDWIGGSTDQVVIWRKWPTISGPHPEMGVSVWQMHSRQVLVPQFVADQLKSDMEKGTTG
jgi:hypothetical protein